MPSSFTPPVITAAGGMFLQLPTLYAGLRDFWHSFDLNLAQGDLLSTWTGVKGNQLTVAGMIAAGYASASAPFFSAGGIGGAPSVEFSSTASLATPNALASGTYSSGAMTCFVFYPKTWTGGNSTVTIEQYGRFADSFITLFAPAATGTGGTPNTLQSYNIQASGFHGTTAAKRAIPFQPHVLIVNYVGANIYLWLDGVCVFAGTNDVTSPVLVGAVTIGNIEAALVTLTWGIGAKGLWERSGTDAEIRGMSNFLMGQFFRNTNARIIATGDSFGQGISCAGNTTLYDQLQPYFPDRRMVNACVSGNTVQAQVANAAPYPNMYNAIKMGDCVLIWPGQTDIANGRTAAQVYADMATLSARARSYGGKTLAITPIPKKYSNTGATQTACEAVRQSLITLINADTGEFDGIVDLNVAPFDDPTLYTDAAYYTPADDIGGHETTAAFTAMVPIFLPIIKYVWGLT